MRPKSTLRSLAAMAGVAAIILIPAAAQAADLTISINPGNVPTTAQDFGSRSCDGIPGGRQANQDGWVFVLPSDHGSKGSFASVTATYTDASGGTHTFTTGANGGIVDSPGANATSKAYILTPLGWTLTGATAQATGVSEDAKFNLTHTCPGRPCESSSSSSPPSSSPPASSPPAESSSSSSSGSSGSSSSASSSAAHHSGAAGGTVPGSSGGGLPVTGASLTVAISIAAALLLLGAAALWLARRRALAGLSEDGQ